MTRVSRLSQAAPPVLVFFATLAIWYFYSFVVLSPETRFLFPPPHQIVTSAFLDTANLTELLEAFALTASVAMIGLAIAIILGVGLAVLMSQALWVERSLYPYAVVLQAVPILALVPLIGQWFGYGFGSRVLVCVLIALFPLIANTLFGLRSVDAGMRDLFRLCNAGRRARLVKLALPAALPAVFTGLRISAGLSVIGAIVGDLFFRQGPPGVGTLIDLYKDNLAYDLTFAAVGLASLFGVCVFWFFGFLARRVVGPWHESARVGAAG